MSYSLFLQWSRGSGQYVVSTYAMSEGHGPSGSAGGEPASGVALAIGRTEGGGSGTGGRGGGTGAIVSRLPQPTMNDTRTRIKARRIVVGCRPFE